MGYLHSFGLMAGIYVAVFLIGVPLFWFGKRVRRASFRWKIMAYLDWNDDRETGE